MKYFIFDLLQLKLIDSCCNTLQAKYIATCLDEIKQELRQENAAVKANAVSKLTYVSTFTLKLWLRMLIIS